MTQKRFIKLMRAAGYPRYLINKAVNTVKLRGGSLSHQKYMLNFNLTSILTNAPDEMIISRMEKNAETYSRFHCMPKIEPLARSRRHYGKTAQYTTIDEMHEYLPRLFQIDDKDESNETEREMWTKKESEE